MATAEAARWIRDEGEVVKLSNETQCILILGAMAVMSLAFFALGAWVAP